MNGKAVDYTIPVEVVEADVPGDTKGLAIQGKFDMDRTKHDITYRSQTFDDKLDWFIKDEVERLDSRSSACPPCDVNPLSSIKKGRAVAGLFCVPTLGRPESGRPQLNRLFSLPSMEVMMPPRSSLLSWKLLLSTSMIKSSPLL